MTCNVNVEKSKGDIRMKKLITATLVSLAFAGTAIADQIYIDNGFDYGGNNINTAAGDTTTGWKNSLTFKYNSNSVVTDEDFNGLDIGDTIISAGGLIGSETINNNLITGLIAAESFGTGPSDNEYGSSNWVLSFRFDDFMGTFDGTDFIYTSGTIDMFLFDGQNGGLSNEIQLFSMDLVKHVATSGNHVYNGKMSNFGSDVVNGVSAGDIFNIAYGSSSISFEDYAMLAGENVRFRLDQNTDKVDENSLEQIGNTNRFELSGQHDGSIEFQVPEPTSLAILGLGLLGFAGSRRRKS